VAVAVVVVRVIMGVIVTMPGPISMHVLVEVIVMMRRSVTVADGMRMGVRMAVLMLMAMIAAVTGTLGVGAIVVVGMATHGGFLSGLKIEDRGA
jgi:hypothetical protein